MKVVIDANVVVSAIFGGTPLKSIEIAFKGSVYTSPAVEEELRRLPEKLSFKLSPSKILLFKKYLHYFLLNTICIHPTKKYELCRDPADNAYLDLAGEAEAEYLITGDKDLLSLSRPELKTVGLGVVRIVTPARFVRLFQDHTT